MACFQRFMENDCFAARASPFTREYEIHCTVITIDNGAIQIFPFSFDRDVRFIDPSQVVVKCKIGTDPFVQFYV